MIRKKLPVSEETLRRIIDELSEFVVIVEGKKDKKALKTLGVKKILSINSRSLIDIVTDLRKIGANEVVVLTDFDKQGRKIELKLRKLLQQYKIKVNSRLRWNVMRLGRNKIEDLHTLAKAYGTEPMDIRTGMLSAAGSGSGGDSHGEISANIDKVSHKSNHTGKRSHRKTRRHRSHIRANRRAARL